MYKFIPDRVGRRGLALALIGTMWIMRGLYLPDDPGRGIDDEAVLYEMFLSVPTRQILWIGTGAVAFLAAKHPRTQWLGWIAICVMPIERAVGHLWSLIMWLIPGMPQGSEHSIFYTLYWLCWVLAINLLATWGEDADTQMSRALEE